MNRQGLFAVFASAALLAACQTLPMPSTTEGAPQVGLASWYGWHFQRKRTANGERFNMNGLTAASPTLPFNSYVRVTNLVNGRTVVVRINDRGPYVSGRIIDLSAKAARELGIMEDGVARVRIDLIDTSSAKL